MRRVFALVFVVWAGTAAAGTAATFTVTNTGDSGAGSLRKAITDANAAAGADTIAFNVSGAGCDGAGVCTIVPQSVLPTVSGTLLIDGYTQPGSSPNTNASGALNTALKIVISGHPRCRQPRPPGQRGRTRHSRPRDQRRIQLHDFESAARRIGPGLFHRHRRRRE